MKQVKTRESDLESRRFPLFMLGLTFAAALVLTAFEWTTFSDPQHSWSDGCPSMLLDEVVLNSFPPEKKLPPPPPKRQVADVFAFVENDRLLNEDFHLPDIDEPYDIDPLEDPLDYADEERIFYSHEAMPDFPGGIEAMYAYLARELRYPAMAKNAGISGKVYVQFIVNKEGDVESVKLLRGIGGGCDEEALRVVSAMPRWKPALQNGKPVSVMFNIPLVFSLR